MKVLKSFIILAVVSSWISCNSQKKDVTSLKTEIDSASYALGLDMAIKVKANFKEGNTDLFLQGYRNGIDSTNLLMDQKDLNVFLGAFFQKMQQEKMKKETEKNFGAVKKAGEDFLAENKVKQGIVTTESGLQYEILQKGSGENILPTSKIKIHYHGSLIDGTVFDSSVDRKQPIDATANQFIPGFNEGLLLMNKGAKYRFYIPQELAYGMQQKSQEIKPYSVLIFEVEVLEVTNE
ncbi:MAG: FKBP-type peptidyl-prolyl cis-trans isomerase [Flavobacteriia bacterium]|nr:FKBP-type peptidyl-prolyl cis-trans isomerase [Flavobacteriia bacterium]OIP48765.1 MAG: peptidylprolyl isomerase [Flavobacteriaceae bacterium CG2_30_31_66]PIV95485.1 MAG: peptidylprolyl isomerase [Flavobacteriaceae bacterium CG17_big_fil_post_rev_8_21_14_2_50_31_13]PIX14098.1 MAG: peptidylprolyl isomerase [Flavobacteriaceae bacterium CG_4_8_14_3_um_filter_31_8]PIY14194.1 MAG: peptidylprolyl isomerase [Flavobacteriaceae bacterium CG_4_10_14_3_um_filter_31_253]PIZ10303.1 MAG: peptidylprolyl i